jgi:hypothetical protein
MEIIIAYGHPNIRAIHTTTLEITRDEHLTPRGDCIIGIKADKGLADLKEETRIHLKNGKQFEVIFHLPDYDIEERVIGYGHNALSLTHSSDIVIRKSRYICNRTMLIQADKAAIDLKREFVYLLQDSKTEMIVKIIPKDKNFMG